MSNELLVPIFEVHASSPLPWVGHSSLVSVRARALLRQRSRAAAQVLHRAKLLDDMALSEVCGTKLVGIFEAEGRNPAVTCIQ